MAKISELPAVPSPDGSEQVIVLKDGATQRATISGMMSRALDSAWYYAGKSAAQPMVTDLLGNILQYAQNGYLYPSRDPDDPGLSADFIRRARSAGLDSVWTYGGKGSVLVTDLVGNIISYAAGGITYSIPDPNDPGFAPKFQNSMKSAGFGDVWTYVGGSDVIVTDLVGNIIATTSSLAKTAGAVRRIEPVPLKASLLLTADRQWTGTLISGQSLSVGEHAYGVISNSQPFANLTFGSGPGSTKSGSTGSNGSPGVSTSMPLVETLVRAEDAGLWGAGESPCSGTANFAVERALRKGLIASPADYVNFAWTSGHTGYTLDQLTADAWFQLLRDQVDGFVALAMAAGKTHAIPAIYWIQGNADVSAGTSYEAYKTKLKAYRAKVEAYVQSRIANNGPVALVMVQCEYGLSTTSAIALAQIDLVRSEPHFYCVGPTYHLPHYQTESHLVAAGYKWMGCYFGRAKAQLEREQVVPDWLQLLSVSYYGGEAKFRWRVPAQPIVIDEALCGSTAQSGLAIRDSNGLVGLSNVRVTAADEITATCARPPLAGATGRVALDFKGASIKLGNACTSNIRDSSEETCVVGGIVRPLWRVAPAQELPVLFIQG
ncbi:hypothetical protein [Novosphingobium sp.]|uniref:hypothetical protein n=1 Tax=Novosphingobium sp. TaxID=1874826 RepID=UPI002FDCF202